MGGTHSVATEASYTAAATPVVASQRENSGDGGQPRLTVLSKVLIGALGLSFVVNVLFCCFYIFRSTAHQHEDEKSFHSNDYVMRNNEVYATSPVTSLDDVATLNDNPLYSAYKNETDVVKTTS